MNSDRKDWHVIACTTNMIKDIHQSDFIIISALTVDNMKEMLDQAWDYRARWRFIGIQLCIDEGTLDALDADNHKVEDCLAGLISKWLRNMKPRPTRAAMTKALESQSVAGSAAPVMEGMQDCIIFTLTPVGRFSF